MGKILLYHYWNRESYIYYKYMPEHNYGYDDCYHRMNKEAASGIDMYHGDDLKYILSFIEGIEKRGCKNEFIVYSLKKNAMVSRAELGSAQVRAKGQVWYKKGSYLNPDEGYLASHCPMGRHRGRREFRDMFLSNCFKELSHMQSFKNEDYYPLIRHSMDMSDLAGTRRYNWSRCYRSQTGASWKKSCKVDKQYKKNKKNLYSFRRASKIEYNEHYDSVVGICDFEESNYEYDTN